MWRALAHDSTAVHPDAPEDPALMPISADTITKDTLSARSKIATAHWDSRASQLFQAVKSNAHPASNVAMQGRFWIPPLYPLTSVSRMQDLFVGAIPPRSYGHQSQYTSNHVLLWQPRAGQ